MSRTTYGNSWISGENWDASNWGEEAIFPMKCLILQVYFLLPKLCLTSSYEPGMMCIASSAAFGPTSSAFIQFYFPFSLLRCKVQAEKWDSDPAHTCCSSCWATRVSGLLHTQLGSVLTRHVPVAPGHSGGCLVAPNSSYRTHGGKVKTLMLSCIK